MSMLQSTGRIGRLVVETYRRLLSSGQRGISKTAIGASDQVWSEAEIVLNTYSSETAIMH
jgi:hypothetical protein